MTDAPLCKDCTHLRCTVGNGHSPSRSWCTRPVGMTHDLVRGEYITHGHFDPYSERASMRSLFGRSKCGPVGRYFRKATPTPPPAQRGK